MAYFEFVSWTWWFIDLLIQMLGTGITVLWRWRTGMKSLHCSGNICSNPFYLNLDKNWNTKCRKLMTLNEFDLILFFWRTKVETNSNTIQSMVQEKYECSTHFWKQKMPWNKNRKVSKTVNHCFTYRAYHFAFRALMAFKKVHNRFNNKQKQFSANLFCLSFEYAKCALQILHKSDNWCKLKLLKD